MHNSGPGDVITIKKDNLLDTIPTWGPTFTVSLELYINSWNSEGVQHSETSQEVLRFTNADQPSSDGDTRHNWPQIATQLVNGTGIVWVRLDPDLTSAKIETIQTKRWHKLELFQFEKNDSVM